MADTKLEVLFELNSKLDGINNAINRVERAEKSTSRLNRVTTKLGKIFSSVTKRLAQGALIAGTALFAAGGLFAKESFNKFAQFEASMKGVEAVLKPTTKQLGLLDAEAKRLGRTTKFSAREAASGIEVLAKNGVKTEQILGGVLESSLTLSASVGAELPAAADVITDVLQVFSLQASDAAAAVDSINAVTINSKFGFDDYAAALAAGGASAVVAGQSFEDFNNTITATASFFDSGETAGTAYKVFMDRLIPSSEAAAAASKKLGLDVFDAEGNLRDMAIIAGQLDRGLAGLSEEDRIKSLKDLFGTRGKNFAVSLAKVGEEGVRTAEFLAQFADATAQAEKRLEGAQGTLIKFKSAFEGVQLAFGEPLADQITPLIAAATVELGKFAEDGDGAKLVVDTILGSVVEFAAVGTDSIKGVRAGVQLLAIGALQLAGGILKINEPFRHLALVGVNALRSIAVGAGIVGNALISEVLDPINSFLVLVGKEPIKFQINTIEIADKFDALTAQAEGVVGAVDEMQQTLNNAKIEAGDDFAEIVNGVSGDDIRNKYREIQESAKLIQSASAILRDEERLFLDLQQGLQEAVTEKAPQDEIDVLKKLITAQDEVVRKRKSALDELKGGSEEAQAANAETANSADEVVSSVENLASTTGVSVDQMVGAFSRLESNGSAHLQGLSNNLDSIKAKLAEVTAAGNRFEDAAVTNSWLKDFALKGIDFLQNLATNGFDVIKGKLGTLTQAGIASTALATGQFSTDFSNPGLAKIAGGDSEAAGIAGGLLSDEDQIRLQHAKDRQVIAEEETLSGEQRRALLVGIEQETQRALADVQIRAADDAARRTQDRVSQTAGFLEDLTTIIFGEGKKAFRINQAIAIGQATIEGILAVQRAWASAPYPFNLPAVAITGAATIANVTKISSQQPPSYITGGLVGDRLSPGQRRDDTFANVATGEFILNPQATARNFDLVNGLNSGFSPESLLNIDRDVSTTIDVSPEIEVDVSPSPSGNNSQDVNIFFDENAFFDRMESRMRQTAVDAVEENRTQFGL